MEKTYNIYIHMYVYDVYTHLRLKHFVTVGIDLVTQDKHVHVSVFTCNTLQRKPTLDPKNGFLRIATSLVCGGAHKAARIGCLQHMTTRNNSDIIR